MKDLVLWVHFVKQAGWDRATAQGPIIVQIREPTAAGVGKSDCDHELCKL